LKSGGDDVDNGDMADKAETKHDEVISMLKGVVVAKPSLNWTVCYDDYGVKYWARDHGHMQWERPWWMC